LDRLDAFVVIVIIIIVVVFFFFLLLLLLLFFQQSFLEHFSHNLPGKMALTNCPAVIGVGVGPVTTTKTVDVVVGRSWIVVRDGLRVS